MKKTHLTLLLGLLTFSAVHAQQTVIVQRPGIFTDIATALVTVPAAALTGLVEGTVESVGSLINGSTTVVTSHVPAVVVPAPVVMPQRQVVVTSPIVTGGPSTTVVTTTPEPVVVPGAVVVLHPNPTTRVITDYGNGTTVTVTRPASAYELGHNVVYPVAPGHRVGSSPFVNPYIYRPR